MVRNNATVVYMQTLHNTLSFTHMFNAGKTTLRI